MNAEGGIVEDVDEDTAAHIELASPLGTPDGTPVTGRKHDPSHSHSQWHLYQASAAASNDFGGGGDMSHVHSYDSGSGRTLPESISRSARRKLSSIRKWATSSERTVAREELMFGEVPMPDLELQLDDMKTDADDWGEVVAEKALIRSSVSIGAGTPKMGHKVSLPKPRPKPRHKSGLCLIL